MADNELTYSTIVSSTDITDTGVSWRPVRTIYPIDTLIVRDRLNKVAQITAPAPASSDPSGTGGIPEVLLSLSAVQTASKQQDRVFSLVSISFTRDPSDANFASVDIWFTGYKGNTNPVLMTSGVDSPISFLCEATKETVVVTAQTVGSGGQTADLSFALTTTVTLSGVVSAPPAPSIAQSLVSTPTGIQFAFNQEGGLLEDVIQTYKVYKNSTNSTGTATVFKTFPQDPTNAGGQVVVEDVLANGTLSYYWVSAVNTSGLESSLTSVTGSGTIISGLAPTSDNMVRNGDFSGGNANWSQVPTSSIITGASGVPVGNSYLQWNSSQGTGFIECDDYYPVDTNKSYLMSCWVKMAGNTSNNQWAGFHEYDSNKNAISHVSGGSFACYCLYAGISQTSGGQFSEPSTNGWQYFEGIVNGPAISNSSAPGPPGIYQFAANTAFIRPIFLFNDTGTAQTVQVSGVRISKVEAVTINAYKKATGVNLIANPDFANGTSGYSVYDNNSTGNVTTSVVNNSTAPNSTGKVLQISTASGAAPSPGLGGFTVSMGVDSGTLTVGQYHKGDQILVRMTASIPSGYTVHYASNAFGNEGTVTWLRSQAGRGTWYEYLLLITIGVTGSFNTIGYFWISNELSAPVTWQVATFEMIDINQVQLTGSNYRLYRQGQSTDLLTQGSIIPTQAFIITFTLGPTNINLSWSSQSLFRADGSTFTVSGGTQGYSSLSNSTTYYIYPYINLSNNTVAFTNGSPPTTTSGGNSTQAVETAFDQRVPLAPLVLQTQSSGGTGGTGGGSGSGGGGTCPEQNELVEVQRDGQVIQIKIGDLQRTDLLKGFSFPQNKDVYRPVRNIYRKSCAAWYMVDAHRVSPCEPVWKSNQWMPAHKAPGATLDTTVGIKVDVVVKVDDYSEHNFWLIGGTAPLLIHNWIPAS